MKFGLNHNTQYMTGKEGGGVVGGDFLTLGYEGLYGRRERVEFPPERATMSLTPEVR